jgi:hypothetical protein
VVALYEYNAENPRTLRLIDCVTNPGDRIQASVGANRSYTIQLGGANATGGSVTLHADYFPDQDADGEFDELDQCPDVAGTQDGCPPELKARPALTYDTLGSGARITRLYVDRVPKGAKVVAKCGGCGSQTVKASKTGRVTLSKLIGKTVASGKSVEIKVTLGKSGDGTYRFGATGNYVKYTFAGGRIGKRQDRCLNAKSGKVEKCS